MQPESPWRITAEGIDLTVRLTPKGGRDAIEGVAILSDGRSVLKARVRAAPSEGEANDALCRLVAKSLGIPPRDVTLASGATARMKRLGIKGESSRLIAALEKTIERSQEK